MQGENQVGWFLSLSNMSKSKVTSPISLSLLLLGVIVILGAVLRLYDLGHIPVSLYWDEAAMLVDVKSVAATGHDMHGNSWLQALYPSYGDYKLPVYIWLASSLGAVLGAQEWVVRLPSALAGIGTIILGGAIAYELCQRLGSRSSTKFARILVPVTMLVIAIAPWSIMFSRTAFEGHLGQFWLGLSVWCLLRSRTKWQWLVVAAILGAVATYTYFSVRFVWPPVFVGYFLLFQYPSWWPKLSRGQWLSAVKNIALTGVVPIVVFGLLLLPMTHSPWYAESNRFRLSTTSVLSNDQLILQSNVYREMAGNTPLDRLVFHRHWLTGRELAQNYADHLSLNFLFMTGDPNLRHGTGQHGLFLLVFLPFFLWGLYGLYDTQKRILLFLVIWWLAALLPASVPETTPHALRSLNALLPLALIIGWGLGLAYEWWGSIKNQLIKLVLGVGLTVVMFVSVLQFCQYYFTIYPAASATEWQQGYKEVAQAVSRMKGEYPAYVNIFDDRFYLWLMAFGPYTGSDFTQWPSQGFQFKEFDRIYFTSFPGWENVENDEPQVVIATTPDEAVSLLEKHPMTIIESQVIPDPYGEPKLQVLLVKKAAAAQQ